MNQNIRSNKYIVAVSGGVDSAALLNMLIVNKLSNYRGGDFVVAHFDHGIRKDSHKDRLFVEELAASYQLPFEYKEGKLGKNAKEDLARKARYRFLRYVKKKHNAKAIITAHHQDDVVETIIINILRGTGRKGLSSLNSKDDVIRPLLDYSKKQLYEYVIKHDLQWREDETNTDKTILRNWIRSEITPKLSQEQRNHLISTYNQARDINDEVDSLLSSIYRKKGGELERKTVILLPHSIARELVAQWLRDQGLRSFKSDTLERILVGAKTLKPGSLIDVYGGKRVKILQDKLTIT